MSREALTKEFGLQAESAAEAASKAACVKDALIANDLEETEAHKRISEALGIAPPNPSKKPPANSPVQPAETIE